MGHLRILFLRQRASFARRTILLLAALALLGSANGLDITTTPEGRQRVFDALVDTFRTHYWNEDHLDWDAWADRHRDAALAAESRSAFDSVLRRMVAGVADNHSSWVGLVRYVPDESGVPRAPATVGLGIQHTYLTGTGLLIERVFPGTPAYDAGLKRGDVVTRINGQDVRDLASAHLVQTAIANAITTGDVRLGLRRRNAHVNVQVIPKPVRFDEARDRPFGEMLDSTTGYIYLPTFNVPRVAQEFHLELERLKGNGAQSLVLDLRGNLGGRLLELGLVLGAFIEGPWAQAISRGEVAWQSSYEFERGRGRNVLLGLDDSVTGELSLESPVRFRGPLVVLVDRNNASAGEIAPLVLQTMGRAVVVGEPTAGNVEAIRGFDLPDGSLVMVAVANVQSVDGMAFDGGVLPDVMAREDPLELARGFDAPLGEAVRVLKSLPFTPGRFF